MKRAASRVAAALADPTRESIVRLLIEGERSVGEIAERLPVSRPAVSKHLRVLRVPLASAPRLRRTTRRSKTTLLSMQSRWVQWKLN